MKLSVLTATYNRSNYLEKLYKSILKNIETSNIEAEWIIINDGSILISVVKAGNDETELEADFKKAQQLAINLDNIKDIDHTIVVQDKDKSFSISPLHRKKKSAEEKKEEVKEEKVEEKKEEVKEEKKPEKKKKSLNVDEEII